MHIELVLLPSTNHQRILKLTSINYEPKPLIPYQTNQSNNIIPTEDNRSPSRHVIKFETQLPDANKYNNATSMPLLTDDNGVSTAITANPLILPDTFGIPILPLLPHPLSKKILESNSHNTLV